MTNNMHGATPGQATSEYKTDTTTIYQHPDGFTLATINRLILRAWCFAPSCWLKSWRAAR